MQTKSRQDHSSAQGTLKYRRSYKACLNCRARKVKCDMGPVDIPHGPPCSRCKRERKMCEFPPPKKRAQSKQEQVHIVNEVPTSQSQRITSGSDKANSYTKIPEHCIDTVDVKWKFEINSMQNALEFLAKAAGSASTKEVKDTNSESHHHSRLKKLSHQSDEDNQVCYNSNTMLDTPDESFHAPLISPQGTQRATAPLIKQLSRLRPKSSIKLIDIEYIGESNMLSEHEAIKLIEVFFLSMHPFFPHIPLQLQDPQELVRYPLLLCTILTISSRYQSFPELGLSNGENGGRNIEVHERLWVHCQRLMSQTIWAEASTRSIGTVLAFLLFTEWNPRAIHSRWSDYANHTGLNDVSKRNTGDIGIIKETGGLTGMGSIRRSDRMAWMLTGSAVRLAQDMGFIDTNSKIFTAAHISETQTAMNLNQRSILAESLNEASLRNNDKPKNLENERFYLDQILQNDESKERWTKFLEEMKDSELSDGNKLFTDMESEFLNDEYILYYATAKASEDSTMRGQVSNPLPFPLRFTKSQSAKLELSKIISIGYETIYCDKGKRQLLIDDPRSNLVLLQILSPLIENWHKDYHGLLRPSRDTAEYSTEFCKNKRAVYEFTRLVDGESLICDYSYCQLYIYSLALQVDFKENTFTLKEIARSAKYVEIAYNAAKEILNSAERLKALRMVRFMPIRWVTKIVRAIAFIVKCYLTLTGNAVFNNPVANAILRLSVIPIEETLQIVEKAAATLKEASPDDLHLGMKYSAIMTYFCTEMKSNIHKNPEDTYPDQKQSLHHETSNRSSDATPQQAQCNLDPHCFFHLNQQEVLEQPVVRSPPDAPPNVLASNGVTSLPNEVMDWFFTSEEIGLDFVDSWTEMMEQKYLQSESALQSQLQEPQQTNSP